MCLFRFARKVGIGMIKRFFGIALSLALILSVLFVNAGAADAQIRQADVALPDVKFEINGSYGADDITSIVLGEEDLDLKEVYSGEKVDSKLVYVLVDISTSMSQQYLNALKPSLINYALSFGEKDKFVLKTFGEKVETVLKGGEDSETIKSAINGLKCNSPGTTFYSALNNTLKASLKEDEYTRMFSIVISDGTDFEKGNSSQEEVVENYNTHRLPVYGLCASNASKAEADGFGYIARTSGGELVQFSNSNASDKFNEILSLSDDVTVVEAVSSKKKTVGREILSVCINSDRVEQEVWVAASEDKVPPTVDEITFDKESGCFVIKFSEAVENADKASSFVITKNGKAVSVNSVEYENEVSKLRTDDKVYSGEYTFKFVNICDATDNKNPLADENVTQNIKAYSIISVVLTIAGIALIPIAFLVALYLILLNLKKKKQVEKIKDIFVTQVEEKEVEHISVKQPDGMKLKVHIDCNNGKQHQLDYNLLSSVIIGRDGICDISIDDNKMSQQHFVVEQVDNGLAVTDLESTNGTFVNGIRIRSRTFIPSGSKICAGNSIITIMY